ncbi:hypothetical protein LINPERHAP2_LOCUS415, partial [Linum perenne]
DYKLVAEVWNQIHEFDCTSADWKTNFKTWSCFFLKSDHGTLFGITCWLIWKARNDRVFAGTSPNPLGVAIKSIAWNKNTEEAIKRDNFVLDSRTIRHEVEIAWDPGPPRWVTLNTDGSINPIRGAVAAGGLLRVEQGRCLMAFTLNLENCLITRAELRGAIEGLQALGMRVIDR